MAVCPICSEPTFANGRCDTCGFSGKIEGLDEPLDSTDAFGAGSRPAREEARALVHSQRPMRPMRPMDGERDGERDEEPDGIAAADTRRNFRGDVARDVAEDVGGDDGIEPMPGLEPTEIVPRSTQPGSRVRRRDGRDASSSEARAGGATPAGLAGGRETSSDDGFVYRTCPSCGASPGEPTPTLCEVCGFRLRPRRKGASEEESRRCRECGVMNRASVSHCVNCGRLV